MGQTESQFTEEELQDYVDLTFLSKEEVLIAHKKFKSLAPEIVSHDRNAKLSMSTILKFPELSVNPFGERICKVFSSSNDSQMNFEDFLDMMSVFSEACPTSLKAEYAFRIMDFDGDDMLGMDDLKNVIQRLIGEENHLDECGMEELIHSILAEGDLDDDGALSFSEFEFVIDKSRDFTNKLDRMTIPKDWIKHGELFTDSDFKSHYVCKICQKRETRFLAGYIAQDAFTFWKHIEDFHAIRNTSSIQHRYHNKDEANRNKTSKRNFQKTDSIETIILDDDEEDDLDQQMSNIFGPETREDDERDKKPIPQSLITKIGWFRYMKSKEMQTMWSGIKNKMWFNQWVTYIKEESGPNPNP